MITREITKRDCWGYDLAYSIAGLSLCRYKMGAVIIAGNRVLSTGVNILKTHSDHKKWPNHVVSIHSEHHAIIRCKADTHHATMYVARSGGNEVSKPCDMCLEYIHIAGIRYIVYKTVEGVLTKVKLV